MKSVKSFIVAVVMLLTPVFSLAGNSGDIAIVERRMYNSLLAGAPSSSEVESLLGSINAEGGFLDIDYLDDEFNSGDKKRKHLQKTLRLAKAYVDTKGKYYHSDKLYTSIESLLKFWLDGNFDDDNWWHRSIGFPKDLMPTAVLMKGAMEKRNPDMLAQITDYLSYSWEHTPPRLRKGANGTDISKITFAEAVLSCNAELMESVMSFVSSLIYIAEGGTQEGIYPDYSFSQHSENGRQLYLGTYGREFLDGTLFFMEYTHGTKFALESEKVAMIENLMIDGVAWMWYRNDLDPNQLGRKIYDRINFAPSFVALTKRVIALDTPQREAIEDVLAMMEGRRELIGNKAYPYHDYMIHRGDGYMTTVRMTSDRTVGNEAGNGQGLENYHTGDGATYFRVDGDEYSSIFSEWNWRMIPGTTLVADTAPMLQPMWGKGGQGGDLFAGVASNGEEGCAGFIFNKDDLLAHKAWFNFDDVTIALGAGITTSRSDGTVVTTINQTALKGEVIANKDDVWHNKIGYKSLYNGNIVIATNDRESILTLSLDHGVAPEMDSYSYAVYPNVELSEFKSKESGVELLMNSAEVQAVKESKSGIVMAIFYQAGSLEVDKRVTLEASAPAVVIATPKGKGDYSVIVESPFCERAPKEAIDVMVKRGKSLINR